MNGPAFQDRIPDNFCYGCGPDNPKGLHLKSFWEGEESVALFTPRLFHAAGPRHVLNGGVIATIIDCHCICTAIADAYRRAGRDIGSEPLIWYATASLRVDYLRPTPLAGEVNLRARIVDTDDKKTRLVCSLSAENRECARGEVLAVRVSAGWRQEPEQASSKSG
jgi:acyl-coenzyme A thioesterase PaaI-like protein